MRPDALPVRPAGSHVELPARLATTLFGAALTGGERLAVIRLGETVARIDVRPGDRLRLVLDALDADAAGTGPLRLAGPVGAIGAPASERVATVLTLPDGLRRAWGVPDRATLVLGGVATDAAVGTGLVAEVRAERALWLAAGKPETARWAPGTPLAFAPPPVAADNGTDAIERGVVTETDVRQARLRHRRIALRPGQIVTPGARDLAREWDVFSGG